VEVEEREDMGLRLEMKREEDMKMKKVES
jgi:hypothetical protein